MLLQLLSVAREPLRLEQLRELLGVLGQPLMLDDCRDRLEEVSQWLLDVGGQRYKPWHQGLADHVLKRELGEADVRQREEELCRWLSADSRETQGYGLRHRVSHLLAAGRVAEASALLKDWRWLEAKVEAGGVFGLVGDFAALGAALPEGAEPRWFGLVEEAIRRDIHFIDRHHQDYPQGLFQCLWASCWWYDNPEAAKYYDLTKRRGMGPLPWESDGGRLSNWMERWREEKDRSGCVWLRTLRPPLIHLGTAQKMVLWGHTGSVESVCYSADGRRIVSGSDDGTVRVWDSVSGAELLCLSGHTDSVTSVGLTGNGQRIVSGSWDRTVRVWDANSGTELASLHGHLDSVTSVAISMDGQRIVSGSWDRTVRVWDAASGAELLCLCGHTGWVDSVCLSEDGRCIVSGSWDNTVRVWDVASASEIHCLQGHAGRVTSVSVSSDNRRIVSGSADQTVRLWDAVSGTKLLCLQGHTGGVGSVSLSADGRRIVSGSWDRTVRVWDAVSGTERHCLCGHTDGVGSVSLSADGRRIVSGSLDRTLRVWDAAGGGELLDVRGHTGLMVSVNFSLDGRRLVSQSYDQTVGVWDVDSGKCLHVGSSKRDTRRNKETEGIPDIPGETVITIDESGEALVFFQEGLDSITNYPASCTWAGCTGRMVHLLRLEGVRPA